MPRRVSPGAAHDWKSLCRFAQPLTFSVAKETPSERFPPPNSSSQLAPRATRRSEPHAERVEVDLLGQDCAGAPWVRRHTALSPERLESCRTPRMIPRAGALRSGVATGVRTPAHPFAPLAPRHRVNGASAPTELDQPDTLEPCDSWAPLDRDASGQLVHSTFSKTSTRTTCGCQLARKLADEALTSRCLPHFDRRPLERVGCLSHRAAPPGRPLTLVSPANSPDTEPGPLASQFRFHPCLVKGAGFHVTERLPPARSPSRALCSHPDPPRVCRR